jgi:hypothetical protein
MYYKTTQSYTEFLWQNSWCNMWFNIFINVDMLVYHIITQHFLMHRHGTYKVPWRSLADSSVCYTEAVTRWWEWLLETSSFCLPFFIFYLFIYLFFALLNDAVSFLGCIVLNGKTIGECWIENVCFLLGNSPASEFYMPTYWKLCSIFIGR